MLLRFPGALEAVEAVLELRRDLDAAGLASHAGIHAGPVIEREGDVFGRTVNIAARLAELAAAGQVLATASVAATLDANGPAAIALGEAALTGVAAPLAVVEIAPLGD